MGNTVAVVYSCAHCRVVAKESADHKNIHRYRRRLRKRGESARRSVLGDIVPISDRPPQAADRAFPGHWEGDLIMGAFNRSAIVTVVERRSRFLLLGDLPEGHDAQSVYECLFELTADLPDLLRKSLTWDRGVEMAKWNDLQQDADIDVFFCDPHSPWQRPSNERMNGLLRQYFPKGTDLNLITYDHLKFVAAEMNGRPRKVLGWKTPAEGRCQGECGSQKYTSISAFC